MCGIVGYIGEREALPVLLGGLRKLEYRGYDSAGVAVLGHGGLVVRKAKGRLRNLEERIAREAGLDDGEIPGAGKLPGFEGSLGIGHTRWATHGEPSDSNSHPQTDAAGNIAVVHNGIIENYSSLKEKLIRKGVRFQSQTDTEVAANLINLYFEGDLLQAVIQAVKQMRGSWALGVAAAADPDRVIMVRKENPLVIGVGRGETLAASDVPPLLEYTRDVYYLEDHEIAVLYRDRVEFFNDEGIPIEKKQYHIDWDAEAAEKGGFEHFMLKEIHEQPKGLTDTLRPRLLNKTIDLHEIGLSAELLKRAERIRITACGTAWHAAMVGKYAIEALARLPVEVDTASEFRYRSPLFNPEDIFIIISQSGETADTLAAMRMAKQGGARIIAITNAVGSTLAREADYVMYTWAGPEIAVASTKAFTTQLMCLYLIALEAALQKGAMDKQTQEDYLSSLEAISAGVTEILSHQEGIQKFASLSFNKTKVFYMGRLFDYAVSLESALKLKEISYTHSEAFAAGELKHGPIALVDKSTLVVALCTQRSLFDKMESSITQVKARGASVLVITYKDVDFFDSISDQVFRIPPTKDALSPLLSVVPTQLFAYYCSVLRGLDPDKPRNLAKSVTVE